jgi:hypothetical protein
MMSPQQQQTLTGALDALMNKNATLADQLTPLSLHLDLLSDTKVIAAIDDK